MFKNKKVVSLALVLMIIISSLFVLSSCRDNDRDSKRTIEEDVDVAVRQHISLYFIPQYNGTLQSTNFSSIHPNGDGRYIATGNVIFKDRYGVTYKSTFSATAIVSDTEFPNGLRAYVDDFQYNTPKKQ